MSSDKRITRKQAEENIELREVLEAFYTEPFTSTPLPRSKPDENVVFPAGEPKTLFSGDASQDLSPDSSIFSGPGNLTIKPDETLKFQPSSKLSSITEPSGAEKEEKLFIQSPADISDLFEDKERASNSSITSNSSIEGEKMATKQTISLKDALRVVPEFNGTNIPLSQFLEGCEIAKEMIEIEDEKTFVKLLRSKITGEARQVIINISFDTIEKIKDHLKSIYRPSKSVHQLLGELGNEFQREEESVVTYANRMRDLGNQILEASKIANGSLMAGVKESTLASVIECFKNGLKPEIEQRIRQEASIDEIMKDAIKIERLLEAQRNLRRSTKPTFDSKLATKKHIHYCIECQSLGHDSNDCRKTKYCDFCKRTGHSTEQCFKKDKPTLNIQRPQNSPQTVMCQFCSKIGHTADKCYQLVNFKSTNTSNRVDFTNRLTCQYCGKLGHTADKCYSLNEIRSPADNRARLTCQKCKKDGHTAATCRNTSLNQVATNPVSCSSI